MIEPVVQEKSRKARKKTRLMLSPRFGPSWSAHGDVAPQKPLRRARMALGRTAGLEAAVDVPAEVVEGRRDDGDGEDVLHRRRHDVLAPRHAGLVHHEAGVDQPHHDDREEVELLRQDGRVEADLGADLLHRLRDQARRRASIASPSTAACSTAQIAIRGGYEPTGRLQGQTATVCARRVSELHIVTDRQQLRRSGLDLDHLAGVGVDETLVAFASAGLVASSAPGRRARSRATATRA